MLVRTARAVALAALVGLTLLAVPPASAAPPVELLAGTTPTTTVFPNDAFSVADTTQRTGLRVDLPLPVCPAGSPSLCEDVAFLNTLDGFDLQPRVTLPFSGRIDLRSITPDTVYVEGPGGVRTGLRQLVFDPGTNVLAGIPDDVLPEATAHEIVVTDGVRGSDGVAITGGRRTPFTTLSATTQLDRLRQSLDGGAAYAQAGIGDRSVSFTQPGSATRLVFPAATVTQIQRINQVDARPAEPDTTETVLNAAVAGAGSYGFGSFESPQFVNGRGVIAPTPTTVTPSATGKARIGLTLILPATAKPADGYPVAIFGPGFTRSKYDLFLAADLNAARGVATLAIDPLGHAFGPESQVRVTQLPNTTTTFLGYGRGRDIDGDNVIGSSEGVGPAAQPDSSGPPSSRPDGLVGLRDGLIQTVVDNMALVRAVQAGIDVDGTPGADLRTTGIGYYGQSFGGIYGTMLLGTDPLLEFGVLNVPGGPINEIARTSGFRRLAADSLAANLPSLLNGPPGRFGFTESMPLRLDPPVVAPVPGAIAIQELLARGNWFERSGSPEAYAPLLRRRVPTGKQAKRVLVQVAFGDQTVPNPTSGILVRAGDLYDRVTYYRNDRTASFFINPHGFLLSPFSQGRQQGQAQMLDFLANEGNAAPLDPDGAAPTFEVPIANRINLDCLHYADPQTGAAPAGQANGPDCVDRSAEVGVVPPVIPEAPRALLLPLAALAVAGGLVVRSRRAQRRIWR